VGLIFSLFRRILPLESSRFSSSGLLTFGIDQIRNSLAETRSSGLIRAHFPQADFGTASRLNGRKTTDRSNVAFG
jgi:hypothetical protein